MGKWGGGVVARAQRFLVILLGKSRSGDAGMETRAEMRSQREEIELKIATDTIPRCEI